LSLIDSPHDNVSLTRVLLAPRWRLSEDIALAIRKQASKDRCSIYSALEAVERTLFSAELRGTGWPELKVVLRELKGFSELAPVTALFDRLIARVGFALPPGGSDRRYVDTFRKFLAGWERKSETRKLREFMEYFRYFVEAGGTLEAPEPESRSNAVQMMTVHAAKGLEFPVVFVLSVARQRFPHREEAPVIEFPDELRKGPPAPVDIHLQEERRLFYVAMTRAREHLYVSSVGVPGRKPSAFVDDLLSDPVVSARDIERIQVQQAASEAGTRPIISRAKSARVEGLGQGENEAGQQSLFGSTPESDDLHPDLAGWASLPPPVSPNGKLQLSATAIETYRECPLKFKYTYYSKIPTGAQAALTFGSIMHQSVRYYFRLRREGEPSFEAIREFYLRAWKDLGFEDTYQEQTYKKAGLDQLREFVARHNASAPAADNVALEQRFTLDIGDIVLEGRIDQVNPLAGSAGVAPASPLPGVSTDLAHTRILTADLSTFGTPGAQRSGNGPQAADGRKTKAGGTPALPAGPVELIDYKTGRPRSQKDADKSLQLSVYALAAKRELQMEPVRLTFYNLTNNQPVSTVRSAKDLDKALGEIREVAGKIRSLMFDPKPGFACKYCDFVPICPAHEEDF